MKTLWLPDDLRDKIRGRCVACYPDEACGLLIGRENMVTEVISSPNLSNQPRRNFEIDPALIIRHQKNARHAEQKILGHYHSHPDGQPQPSLQDQNRNYDPELLWVIVQVSDGAAGDMKAYATDPESGQLTAISLKEGCSAVTV